MKQPQTPDPPWVDGDENDTEMPAYKTESDPRFPAVVAAATHYLNGVSIIDTGDLADAILSALDSPVKPDCRHGGNMIWTLKYWLAHPKEALCDLGIKGCELHKRTGWFPWWNRKP